MSRGEVRVIAGVKVGVTTIVKLGGRAKVEVDKATGVKVKLGLRSRVRVRVRAGVKYV